MFQAGTWSTEWPPSPRSILPSGRFGEQSSFEMDKNTQAGTQYSSLVAVDSEKYQVYTFQVRRFPRLQQSNQAGSESYKLNPAGNRTPLCMHRFQWEKRFPHHKRCQRDMTTRLAGSIDLQREYIRRPDNNCFRNKSSACRNLRPLSW
jgi:hypothetical protein